MREFNSLFLKKCNQMQIFYAPGISGNLHFLDENESKHCIRVLRMGKGTTIKLIDGKGKLFDGVITDPDPRKCRIEISSVIADFEARPWYLHIAISPLKNPERFEWFVEKSVEIGIDEITPLLCKNSEKTKIKTERINSIVISAMKQSLKAKLTIINPVTPFKDFIKTNKRGKRLIAHCERGAEKKSIGNCLLKGDDAVILIGPEGDFTHDEIQEATESGFTEVHLGTSRLRTETAGIVACHSVYFLNQE
jgi:16S rRNA (uracil1498-N3)-methyltransferase